MDRWPERHPPVSLVMSIHLSHFLPFWKRVKRYIRSVFGLGPNDSDLDMTTLKHQDTEAMSSLLEEYMADDEGKSPGVSPPPSKR